MEPALVVTAPAKLNLTLEVVRRRPDGFHDICSVMQAISLADRLTLRPAPELSLRCLSPAGRLPELEGLDNLVWRAAVLLREETGETRGAQMVLEKRIPVAAGLGGGSSDAAAALAGLTGLWRLDLSPERMRRLGAELGSDVPFFLGPSGCALAEGRGERLTPLAPLPLCWLVLVKPPAGISAGAVYRAFPPQQWSDGGRTRDWLARAAAEGQIPPPFNALEPVALTVEPAAAVAREALLRAGARSPIMSGSGSTYFALCEGETAAARLCRQLAAGGHEVHVARFTPGPPIEVEAGVGYTL